MKVTGGHVHNDCGKSSAPRLLMTALLRETLILEKKLLLRKLTSGLALVTSHTECKPMTES